MGAVSSGAITFLNLTAMGVGGVSLFIPFGQKGCIFDRFSKSEIHGFSFSAYCSSDLGAVSFIFRGTSDSKRLLWLR